MAHGTPIYLSPDDGLRMVKQTSSGPYRITVFNNPEHIIQALAEKRKRQITRETNERRWS